MISRAAVSPSAKDKIEVRMMGTSTRGDGRPGGRGRGPRTVRAATVDEAAGAVGLAFDRHVTAALNGDRNTRDGSTPLAAGDTVFFLSADASEYVAAASTTASPPDCMNQDFTFPT